MLRVKLSEVDALRARALRRATYPKLGNPPGCDVAQHIRRTAGGGAEVDAHHFAALTDVDARWRALRLANVDDAMAQQTFLLEDCPLGSHDGCGETLKEWSQAMKFVATLIAMKNPAGPPVQVWDPFPRKGCGDPTPEQVAQQGCSSTPEPGAGRLSAASVSGVRGTASELPPVHPLAPFHFPEWIIPFPIPLGGVGASICHNVVFVSCNVPFVVSFPGMYCL
jgi:hypothetical protein